MPSIPSQKEKKADPLSATMDPTSQMTTQDDHIAQEQTKVLQTTTLPTGPIQQETKTELSTLSTSMTEITTEPVPLRTSNNN